MKLLSRRRRMEPLAETAGDRPACFSAYVRRFPLRHALAHAASPAPRCGKDEIEHLLPHCRQRFILARMENAARTRQSTSRTERRRAKASLIASAIVETQAVTSTQMGQRDPECLLRGLQARRRQRSRKRRGGFGRFDRATANARWKSPFALIPAFFAPENVFA